MLICLIEFYPNFEFVLCVVFLKTYDLGKNAFWLTMLTRFCTKEIIPIYISMRDDN